jgi:hypothetical protein
MRSFDAPRIRSCPVARTPPSEQLPWHHRTAACATVSDRESRSLPAAFRRLYKNMAFAAYLPLMRSIGLLSAGGESNLPWLVKPSRSITRRTGARAQGALATSVAGRELACAFFSALTFGHRKTAIQHLLGAARHSSRFQACQHSQANSVLTQCGHLDPKVLLRLAEALTPCRQGSRSRLRMSVG